MSENKTVKVKLEGWQLRVVHERDELRMRITNLDAFIDDKEKFTQLSISSGVWIPAQREAMGDYIKALNERIAEFYKPER